MLPFTEKEVRDLFDNVKTVGRQLRRTVGEAAQTDNMATRRTLLEISFQQADLQFKMAFNQAKMARTERELARRNPNNPRIRVYQPPNNNVR